MRSLKRVAVIVVCFVGIVAWRTDDPPRFSPWSSPVNLGSSINTTGNDSGPSISRDGLVLYFNSDGMGGLGGLDIFMSRRASTEAPWGTPQNLGPAINSSAADNAASLSRDGHWLFFQSSRPGFGGADLYVSWRRHTHDDFGWQPAVNLGSVVNTAANDGGPVYFEDPATRTATLYFFSTRPGVPGGTNIFSSTLQPDGTWAPPVLVEELSSPYIDAQPAISRNGLEMYVSSNRPGSFSSTLDIWVSTRWSTAHPWSAPENAGPAINLPTPYFQGRPSLSSDGTEMYFYAYRPEGLGAQDLYVSTRARLRPTRES